MGEENDILHAVSSEEEVKQTIFDMNPHSAPRPNGFTGLFYDSCWTIIYGDVVRVVVFLSMAV